jgi:hypothetical protein
LIGRLASLNNGPLGAVAPEEEEEKEEEEEEEEEEEAAEAAEAAEEGLLPIRTVPHFQRIYYLSLYCDLSILQYSVP